ncbi:amidohydrolase 2 [Thozetella sp. PMI_491]|nr:amidohydrolase 2 [Thozetella sp. PMI_491]
MRTTEYITPVLSGLATLQGYAQQWYLDKGVKWPAQPPVNKIDVHHHFVPDFYAEGSFTDSASRLLGYAAGWSAPKWSPSSSRMIMKHLGIQSAILSVDAPGACIVQDSEGQAKLARRLNEYAASLRDEDHATFGFFATLPDILNTSAALAEIEYAFDTLHADGISLFTRYGSGNTYLGHPALDPIWKELDRRVATVFVHPTQPAHPMPVNEHIALPLVDFPHETTRTALDMITSRTLKKYPNVKVILSHAGGTLPFLIGRVLSLSMKSSGSVLSWLAGSTHDEVMALFRSFYYDVTMSTSPQILKTLLDLVPHDHVVFGSDFPASPAPAYPTFLQEWEEFDLVPEVRDLWNFGNAQRLVSRLGKQVAELK